MTPTHFAAACVALALSLVSGSAVAQGFLRADGTRIVDDAGRPVLLRVEEVGGPAAASCNMLLLQDSLKPRDNSALPARYQNGEWIKIWEGRRPSDRYERFRLYRRAE